MNNYTGEPAEEQIPRNPDDSIVVDNQYAVDPDPIGPPWGEDGEHEAELFIG
jgi:hypothetical protein